MKRNNYPVPKFYRRRLSVRYRTQGLTLIEVMISLTISLFVLAMTINSLLSLNRSLLINEQSVRLQESLRFAKHQLQLPTNKSQLWHRLQSVAQYEGSMPINKEAVANCEASTTDWAFQVWLAVHALNNNNSDFRCISAGSYLNSDILTLRYLQAEEPTQKINEPFVRIDKNRIKLFRGEDYGYPINQFSAINLLPQAVISQTFYIARTSRTCNGIAIPALYRKYLANGLPKTEEIVSGISHMELMFDIDTDNDEQVDKRVSADSVDNWQNVKSVYVGLIARSECQLPGPGISHSLTVAGKNFEFVDKYMRESLEFIIAI